MYKTLKDIEQDAESLESIFTTTAPETWDVVMRYQEHHSQVSMVVLIMAVTMIWAVATYAIYKWIVNTKNDSNYEPFGEFVAAILCFVGILICLYHAPDIVSDYVYTKYPAIERFKELHQ